MSIRPISFGKTVKINSSVQTASEIANLVNQKPVKGANSELQKQAKEIFCDVKPNGEAYVVTLNGDKDVYILSGEESLKAGKLYDDLISSWDFYHSYYASDDLCQTSCDIANESYTSLLTKLIDTTKANYSIDVETDSKSGAAKKLSIKA